MDQHLPHDTNHAVPLARTPHPWEQYYPADVHWDMPIAKRTLPELFDTAVGRFAHRPAIEYHDRQTTYAELSRLVDRLAAGFIREGMGAGRTIALFLPNTPWHSVCFFAALKAGARLVHLSPLDAPRELAHKMTDSGADIVITTDLGGLAQGAVRLVEAGLAKHLFIAEDRHWGGVPSADLPYGGTVASLESLLADDLPAAWPHIDPDDLALLQYTGGTTGMPKGAMLTHVNMTAATAIYAGWRDEPPSETGQRLLGVLPMFHVYALGIILLCGLVDGHEILLRPRFDVRTTIRDIEEKRANLFPAVPTMLIALLSEPGVEKHDFSSLTSVGSGGAPMPHDVGQRVEALVGRSLRRGWGMTETAAAGTRTPPDGPATPGSIGVPLPRVELRVVALTDPARTLPPGEIGELAVRGPNVFSGYWNQPAMNAESFVDGFFLTGDIGKMDETGLFTIVDRKKRMIISGGFNVYPNMIENAIYEHPDVEEAIVIGVPDQYRGEAAKAFLKLRAGAAEVTLDDLRLFLRDRLGKHELPAHLELRDSLPRSSVGKPLASKLEEEERTKNATT